jgi:psp operon transcriptional activator
LPAGAGVARGVYCQKLGKYAKDRGVERDNQFIGQSGAFLDAVERASRAAPMRRPVLVIGERGTGKELIAARLHYLSNRWDAEFIKMNCAAISDSLLESELFGHEVGAFTGATRNHRGRFERADGGTLFLDELATTSKLVQEKILRIIEYGEFERVGGNKTIRVSVRLVAATNEDLPALADKGVFRRDLLDRLAFDVITLPPLRQRPDDIVLLAEHFAINMATELGQTLFPGFTDRARDALLGHDWPGNVRELKNVVERCVYRNADPLKPVDVITLDPFDSPFRPRGSASAPVSVSAPASVSAFASLKPIASADLPLDLKETVQEFEIDLLNRALEEGRFNQRRAAELLGLTYHQLRGYLKKYNLLKQSDAASE